MSDQSWQPPTVTRETPWWWPVERRSPRPEQVAEMLLRLAGAVELVASTQSAA